VATLRDRPYTQFNFIVDLGDGNTEGPSAGFQEVKGLGMEVAVIEYRNGNSKENNVNQDHRAQQDHGRDDEARNYRHVESVQMARSNWHW
jgi:T4-like virus tail tube protein gp19